MLIRLMILIIGFNSLFLSCIKQPETGNKQVLNDSFSERKRQQSFETVMKALPNIMDIRDTVDLVVLGKLEESLHGNVMISVYEMPGGRVIYKGSLKGVMHLPRNRIRLPVSSLKHEIYGVFTYRGGAIIEKKLDILDSGEVIIRSKDFVYSAFKE